MPFNKQNRTIFNQYTLKYVLDVLYRIALISSVVGLVLLVADFGFTHSPRLNNFFNTSYFFIVLIGIVLASLRHLNLGTQVRKKVMVFDAISVLFSLFVLISYFLFAETYAIVFAYLLRVTVFLTFVREFSELKLVYKRAVLNPAQLFVASFIVIIFIGSLLLKLPNASVHGISFVDALFTSTSAVCVTGLAVVDTGKDFTVFGQFIILFLIQIGGLGILTFASYFSYFFKGETSYENQLTMGDVTSSKKLGEVFSMLKYIILITFFIELISASAIFLTVNDSLFSSVWDKLFFSVFHAVSAFCNAGFSTLSDSLYDGAFKFNALLATGESSGIKATSGGAKVAGRGFGDAWSASVTYENPLLVAGIGYDKAIPSDFLGDGLLNSKDRETQVDEVFAAANTVRAIGRLNPIDGLALKALYQSSEVEETSSILNPPS